VKFTFDARDSHSVISPIIDFFMSLYRCQSRFPSGDHILHGLNQKLEAPKFSGEMRSRAIGPRAIFTISWITTLMSLGAAQAQLPASGTNSVAGVNLALEPSRPDIWQNGVGQGFKPGTKSISINTGAGVGFVSFLGGQQHHDLTFASLSYGRMIGSVEGQGHWYRGNWEVRGEFFGGAQFSPSTEWFVGLTPHLRYNFATGTRWIPYFDGGAGVSATSIGPPDLSHYFEFNLQAGAGVRWFIRDNVALDIEARYLHMSCAGINQPNLGLNNVNGMVGISWFF
jgi:opacity protein-like surface antigen